MTADPEALSTRSRNIFSGAGEAIDWVQAVRKNARSLDNEADGLIEELRRSRNLCRRLGSAAHTPMSIGVFGMSQAGKSYLISTLARGDNGQLQTVLDGERFDFIFHINPPGGGKEATGLVTRFTRQATDAPRGFPIQLTLFSEADLVKVLGNSFFNDFDRERAKFDTEPEHIRQHLAALEKLRQPQPTGGLDEDDMVDLLDYFQKRFTKSMGPLKADFWPQAIELAPRLQPPARARLLSVLWGENNTAFTETYLKLRGALAALGYPRAVYVPLGALVQPGGGGYEWSPDSILNVDVLQRLGKDDAQPLPVLPVVDGEIRPEASVPRSLLAALTAEMKFVLADPPVAQMLEAVDLLDFPGYRGRLNVASLDEVRNDPKLADADPVAELLLRGKVAYLFERYTDDQEMNVLIMCTRCDIQIEITTLTPVLNAWVHSTQGATPADRSARPPGLVWVITQLDKRLTPKPGQSDAQQRQEWGSMIHITLLERFAQCEWLQEWSNGRPFDNLFLMRKPGFLGAIMETVEDGSEVREEGFKPGEEDRLKKQRGLFVEHENVARHVREPVEAWEAVLKPNDGGMGRLASYLGSVSSKAIKLDRIGEQLQQISERADARLGHYFFAEGAGEVEKKQRIVEAVSDAVEQHADSFGDLLFSMQPDSEQLRRLYLRAEVAEPAADAAAGAAEQQRPRSSIVRLPQSTKATAAAKPVLAGRAGIFAKAVLREWYKQLRELPEDAERQRYLGLDLAALRAVADELVVGADRLRIEEKLYETLKVLEDKRSATRTGIVDQQVFLARNIIAEFVDFLGLIDVPASDRPASVFEGRQIFEAPAPIQRQMLPALPEEEAPYPAMFIVDWLTAFRELAIGNAGHSSGRDITPEQNQWLGTILATLGSTAAAV